MVARTPGKPGSIAVKGNEWAIGAMGGGGDRHWKGMLAYVAIWNIARSAEDITVTMGQGPEDGTTFILISALLSSIPSCSFWAGHRIRGPAALLVPRRRRRQERQRGGERGGWGDERRQLMG
eukprot:2152476-Rhodomonas_salina.1